MKKYSTKDNWFAFVLGISPLLLLAFVVVRLQNPLAWDDSLRHFTFAKTMFAEGNALGWDRVFYAGILSEHTVDPWFFANVLYIPFTLLPIGKGLALYSIASILFVAYAFYLLIKDLSISPYMQSLLVVMLLFGDEMFLLRSLLSRPFMVFVGLLLLMIYQLHKRQWGHIALLMILSVLYSQLFVFQIAICILMFIALFLYKQEDDAALLVFTLVCATIIGFLLHPHTGAYLEYFKIFFAIPTMSSSVLGAEMSSGIFASMTVVAIVGYIVLHMFCYAACHTETWKKKLTQDMFYMFLIALTLLFGAMYLLWMRAIDFLWPVALVLLANTLSKFPIEMTTIQSEKKLLRVGMLCILFFCGVNFCTRSIVLLRTDKYRRPEVMSIMQQIEPDSKVLNPEWFMMFPLYAARPDLQYATGIDNTFTHKWDKNAAEYVDLLQNKTFRLKDSIINADAWTKQLLQYFPDSEYIVLSKGRNQYFIEELMNVKTLEPIFDNGESVVSVFKIRK